MCIFVNSKCQLHYFRSGFLVMRNVTTCLDTTKMQQKNYFTINKVYGRWQTGNRKLVYPSLDVRNHVFSRAEQFKYLTSVLTENNEMDKEISTRILAGDTAFFGMVKLLGPRYFLKKLKAQLYSTLLRPIITIWIRNVAIARGRRKKAG